MFEVSSRYLRCLQKHPQKNFKRTLNEVKQQKRTMFAAATTTRTITTTTTTPETSQRVSLRITIARKPNTIGEELILPAVKELAFVKTAKQRDCVPFSNNTVSHRIRDMAASVKGTAQ
jgi:hypothetical protein